MSENKEALLERALYVLHNMALENERPWWAFWRPRWAISHEPLRNDAANIIHDCGAAFMTPIGTRLLGRRP